MKLTRKTALALWKRAKDATRALVGGVVLCLTLGAVSPAATAGVTTTVLTAAPSPSFIGQAVTFTATVMSAGAPTGTVVFQDGATVLGSATVGPDGTATLTTSNLSTGFHAVTAVYSGDGDNFSSSATTGHVVNKAVSSMVLSMPADPSTLGDPVTIAATVTGAGTPTGTVLFMHGAVPIGLIPLDAGGVAVLTTSALTLGHNLIVAEYGGDDDNQPTTGSAIHIVRAASGTVLTSSANPSMAGQTVVFTATVTGNGTPTGTVTFKNGATTLGSSTLGAGGVATLTSTALTAGSHTITAEYGGDGYNHPSSSAPFTQTVNAAASSTMLTSSANPSMVGQTVVFTATVTGNGTPTGTVTFKNGATTLGSSTLGAGGVATLTSTALTAGSHTITAEYGGDGANLPSTSAALTQAVNSAASSTMLTSSANPSMVGQTVVFTATVTGNGTPTGTVTFKNGATTLGSSTLGAGGVATLTTSALTAGSHAISAEYGGGGANLPSISAALTQAVNVATSTTTLVSSANPNAAGQAVTFTATVTSPLGTPSGTVTFLNGGATLGAATLAGGVAAITTTALAVGTHTITASYGGDATTTVSTSAPVVQTVNIPADSIKLRQLQVMATRVAAQASGQAISGAVDAAIADGFNDGAGDMIAPSATGVRLNFAAEPNAASASGAGHTPTGDTVSGPRQQSRARADEAFAEFDPDNARIKAQPRLATPKEWLPWADVRYSGIDRWGSAAGGMAAPLNGSQINALAGLTRRLAPSFLVGAFGGYETFDYSSQEMNGKLTGQGWTVGAYLGWKLAPSLRFNAALAYSGIGYDGVAGRAQGSFDGRRWLISSGLTGSYKAAGFEIEPSANVFALWERENAYTDTLGTLQAERRFSTGRASGGGRVIYPIAWNDALTLAPFVGLYGDYYFTRDDAEAVLAGSLAPAGTALLDGWSARAVGGVTAKFANGGSISLGGELGGVGSDIQVWTFRARAGVPF